ncbi:MAG: argininosuccinate lyase [Paracoccaceae bacterium]
MKPVVSLLIVLALAACGADGAPEKPGPAPKSGVTVSGTVEMGVVGGG